jgi:tRNA pseudouridine32 synthase/23S rRNA pseudouridine746 synthase
VDKYSNLNTKFPCRDGVSASLVVVTPGPWNTIVEFLAARFPAISLSEWTTRMASGDVFDQSGYVVSPDTPFRSHQKIFYYRQLKNELRIPFEETVLYQDELIVVADKPHFLPVIPSGTYLQETLLIRLKRRLGIETLTPMHRIDRDTAGIVLFAVNPSHRNLYQSLFRQKQINKTYQAIASYCKNLAYPLNYYSRLIESRSFMQMIEVEGNANSHTIIDLVETQGMLSRFCLTPITGVKHQLRAHMAALGTPIVNDRIYPHLYPQPNSSDPPNYSQPLKLLAQSIRFCDPITNQHREFHTRQVLNF